MDAQTLQTTGQYMGFTMTNEDALTLLAVINVITNSAVQIATIPVMDLLYTVQHFGIQALLHFIENNKHLIGTNEFIFNQPALEEINRKYENFIEMSLYKSKPVKSDMICINTHCKKQTVEYERIQIRSGDEGTSISFTCTSCGKNWISF